MEMGEMVTCGSVMVKAGETTTYIHHYEGDNFSIHGCD
jgi:hypothetical protein